MTRPSPPPARVNAAGRPIWFAPAAGADSGGVYRAVAPEGRRAFALAVAWTLLCGVGGMALFAMTRDGRAFGAMFVAEAVGLALMVRTVIRHS